MYIYIYIYIYIHIHIHISVSVYKHKRRLVDTSYESYVSGGSGGGIFWGKYKCNT